MSKGIALVGQANDNMDTGATTVGTTAVVLRADSRPLAFGVQIQSDAGNSEGIWVGYRSNLTTSGASSGYKIAPGGTLFFPAKTESQVYCIAGGADQALTFLSL